MGLLAPAFLLAAAAVALPIWLHRLKTQSSERQPFSSAMLLESSQERVHVQRKLKYLILLTLRIALLVLLALAFAKPFINRADNATLDTAAGSILVVVDTSVSMQRTGVFEQALAVAREVITAAPGDVAIQVAAAADGLSAMSTAAIDKAPQRASLAALEPGFARLDYGELMAAVEQLANSLPQPVTLHFVSDFQASGMPVRFSDLVSATVDTFVPHAVGTGDPVNWTIELIRESANGVDVQVSTYGTVQRVADLELRVNGSVAGSQSLTATPQQTVSFDLPELLEGDNRVAAVLAVDDDLDADNRRFHVIENDPPTEVPLVTIDPEGLPATYLSAALESAAGSRYRVTTMMTGRFDNRVLARYRWLVIDDIGAVDDELAAALDRYLRNGGNVLAFAGDRAAALETMPVSGHDQVSGEVSDAARSFLSPSQVDTGHPVLATSTGWHNVNVSRSLPIAPDVSDRVLIRLDNGDPFLLEQAVGQGRMLLVLGGLDNRWNDLPVRPVFVSFIIEAAKYLSGINDIPNAYTVAANLPLALTGNISGQVIDPDGETVLSLADTTREQQIKLDKAGFYEVYTLEGETLVAANIDSLEANPAAIEDDVLKRWTDAANAQTADAQASAIAASADGSEEIRLELWHWLLLFAALLVIGESLLGNVYLAPHRQGQG